MCTFRFMMYIFWFLQPLMLFEQYNIPFRILYCASETSVLLYCQTVSHLCI